MFAFEKIPGLPRERILSVIAPVLHAHGLSGVELVWRTDSQGRVLSLTVEAAGAGEPGAREPGAGVTLDVCSRVSRDLSTALDVSDLIDGNYRLEVGSPGLERRLYALADYARFRGRLAKLKLGTAVAGQHVLVGTLNGVDSEGRVLLSVEGAEHSVAFDEIRSGQLVVDWQQMGFSKAPRQRAGRRPAAHGRK